MDSKVALVTGGASGLGKAYSEIFLEHKVKVCVVDVDGDLGEETVSEFKQRFGKEQVCFTQCDVTDDDQLEGAFKKAISHFEGLDIVVNNAGIVNEANWRLMLSVNLKATIAGCYLAIKYMGTDSGGKGGVIVSTASISGFLPLEATPAYAASKFGIVGYTRSMGLISQQFHGIRINSVCPILVDTPILVKLQKEGMIYCPVAQEIPNKRAEDWGVIEPHQVAEGVWKFVVDESLCGLCMVCGREGNYLVNKIPQDYYEFLERCTDYKK